MKKPKALFYFISPVTGNQVVRLLKMINSLCNSGFDVYANEDFVGFCSKLNSSNINPIADETGFDLFFFEFGDCIYDMIMSRVKSDGLLVSMPILDNMMDTIVSYISVFTLSLMGKLDMYRLLDLEIAKESEPDLPGMDTSPKVCLSVLMRRIRIQINMLAKEDVVMNNRCNYLHKQVLITANTLEMPGILEYVADCCSKALSQPPSPSDPACWDCESKRLRVCALHYKPDITPASEGGDGHCKEWTTNPNVEYGDPPRKRATMDQVLGGIHERGLGG